MDQGKGPQKHGEDAVGPVTSRPMKRVNAGGSNTMMISQPCEKTVQLHESGSVAEAVRCLSETRPVFKIRALLDNRDSWKATDRRLVDVIIEYSPTGCPSYGDHLETSGISPHENVAISLFRSMQELPGWMKAAVQEADRRTMAGTIATYDQLESARAGPAACWVLTGVEPFERSLANWMRDSIPGMPYFLAVDALLQFALGIASGMHHLLQHGVVHRDLKLYDVMWDSKGGPEGVGRAVLTDIWPIARLNDPSGPVSAVDGADRRDQQAPEAGPASGAGRGDGPASVTSERPWGHGAEADTAVEAEDKSSAEQMMAGAGAGPGRDGRQHEGIEREAATVLGRVLEELLAEGMQLHAEFRKAANHAHSDGQGPLAVPAGAPAELQNIASALQGLLSPDPSSRIGVAGAVERLRMAPAKMYYGMSHLLSGLVWEDGSCGGGELTDLFDEVRRDVESSSTLEGVHMLLRLANGVEIVRWARSWDEDPRLAATDEAGEDAAQRECRYALIEAVERAISRDARHLKGMVLEGKHGPLIASLRNAMHGYSMLLNGGEACDVICELVAHVKDEMMCSLVLSEGLTQCAVDLLASSRCSDRTRAAGLIAALGSVVHEPEQMVDACVQANALPWLGGMLERNEFVHGGEAALAAKALLVIVQWVDTEGKRQVVQSGCLTGLARAVSRPGTPAFADSVNIVRRIANESEDLRRAVVQQAGMVAGIIDGFGRADHESAADYIETLITLGSGNDEAMLSLVDAGGMDVVAKAMRSNAGLVESTALRALSSLIDCEGSPLRHTLHRHVLETDMLPNLAFTLTSTRGLDAFWAVKSLFHLSRGNDETKRRIVASGALPGIVWLLYSRRAGAAEVAVRVLQYVPSSKEDWRELVGQTEVMPNLVGLLESNIGGVARYAARVLVRLSGKTLGLLDVVRDACPFPSLVRLLREPGSKDAHVAMKALHAVSEDEQSLVKLRSFADFFPRLVALLGHRATPSEDIARGYKVLTRTLSVANTRVRKTMQQYALHAGCLGAAVELLSYRRESLLSLAALELITSLQGDWKTAIQTLDHRGADVIVAHLDSNDPALRIASANTLARILRDTYKVSILQGCDRYVLASILQAGAVPRVSRLLERDFEDYDARSSFSYLLLLVLDRSSDGMLSVVSAGAVPLLVRYLELYPQDTKAATLAAFAVTYLLAGPQWAVDAVLDVGPFQALVKMIGPGDVPEDGPASEAVAAEHAAVEALASAARLGDHLKLAVTELGSVPFLARIMGHGEPYFRKAAIDCLLELSSGPEPVQLAVADAKVLDGLAKLLLARIRSHKEVVVQLARNLVSRSAAVRHVVASSKLFEALVGQLTDEDMKESRLLLQETVAILTRDPPAMRQLNAMVEPLTWGTVLSELQENVDAGSHRARELRDRLRSFGWYKVEEAEGARGGGGGGDGDFD